MWVFFYAFIKHQHKVLVKKFPLKKLQCVNKFPWIKYNVYKEIWVYNESFPDQYAVNK